MSIPKAELARRREQRAQALAARRAGIVQAGGFFRYEDLVQRYGVERVTIWRWWAKQGVLPPPVHFGPNSVGWSCETILKHEAEHQRPAA
jgi:predicted DNA-binding transcriptional regulator AlpA